MKETLHIVGGGLSGCAFTHFLKKDFNIILYEKSPELGGLLATRKNIENIPWQQVSGILHTNQDWIINLFRKYVDLKPVNYEVAMNPLFDFRYYNYPFNKSTIDTMPWHWKEAILQDLETSNGEYSENMEKMIVNFYGDTVYKIFYKNYFERMFGKENIDLTDWYRTYMRDVNTNFNHYTEKYIMYPTETGWNNVFKKFTEGVNIKFNTCVSISDFSPEDKIIVTTDVSKFSENKNINLYSYGSFDIDSTIYKKNSPDTIIYPNYTPYLSMTQLGRYFTKYEKNIIVKMFIDDGDIPIYPIPTIKRKNKYNEIVKNNPNIMFAGRSGSWSFMHIDDIIEQAQKMSAKIKHSRRKR